MNLEHPPLFKLLATAPLLSLRLRVPPHPSIFSKEEVFTAATQFVYGNDAETILFRTRMSAASLTLALALILFFAAKEMFGSVAALSALSLFVFEPAVLAHGALVTTDMAMSCFLLATVYCFYRYVKLPTAPRLILTALAAGLALASKHSGILIFPILTALAFTELLGRKENLAMPTTRSQQALRLAGAIIVISFISVAVLWVSYGFRLHPRPGLDAQARVIQYALRLHHPIQAQMIAGFARWHLLPEGYLYGLADVGFTADFSHTYLLGRVYPHGVWYYFPIAFLIKSSLALSVFLLLVPLAIFWHRTEHRRELLFLTIPALFYLAVATASRMNIGVRHILPIFPFLFVLAGWAAAKLSERRRSWAYIVAMVLVFDIVSSRRAFPVYVAYANELWGGPANTYKYLSDSNADWAQQLKAVKKYLDSNGVQELLVRIFWRSRRRPFLLRHPLQAADDHRLGLAATFDRGPRPY